MRARTLLLVLVTLLLPLSAGADSSTGRELWGSWTIDLPDDQKAQLAEMEKSVQANTGDELSKAMLEMMKAVIDAKFEIGDGTITATIGGTQEVALWTVTPISAGVWTMVTTDPEGKVSTQIATLNGDLLTIAEEGGQPMQLRRAGSTTAPRAASAEPAPEPAAEPATEVAPVKSKKKKK